MNNIVSTVEEKEPLTITFFVEALDELGAIAQADSKFRKTEGSMNYQVVEHKVNKITYGGGPWSGDWVVEVTYERLFEAPAK